MSHYIRNPSTAEIALSKLLQYSQRVAACVPDKEMARREFLWRNGFFLWREGTPHHVEMLQAVGFGDLMRSAERSSMRMCTYQ
jgi:hypothetical protein